jgi:hypothetical protein
MIAFNNSIAGGRCEIWYVRYAIAITANEKAARTL